MVILHACWIPGPRAEDGRLAIWAESPRPRRARSSSQKRALVRAHPFAASADQIRNALATIGFSASSAEIERRALVALPSIGDGPTASTQEAAEDQPGFDLWRVPTVSLDTLGCLDQLGVMDDADRAATQVGDDLRFWLTARLFALDMLTRQRFWPTMEVENGAFAARWRPLLQEAPDAARATNLANAMPGACAALTWDEQSTRGDRRHRLHDFLRATVDTAARRAAVAPERSARRTEVDAWLAALQGDPRIGGPRERTAALAPAIDGWIGRAQSIGASSPFRVCFRLDPPLPAVAGVKPEQQDWSLSYLLQARDDPSLLVPAEIVWRAMGATARFLDRRIDDPQEHFLAGLGRAARIFAPIGESLDEPRPVGCYLSLAEAYSFLREIALVLQSSGFGVLVPGVDSRIGVRAKLGAPRKAAAKSVGPAELGMTTIVSYDWQIAIGDATLTREEFETLAALKQPLVQVRGRWVELRPDQVDAAFALFAAHPRGSELDLSDAIKLIAAPDVDSPLPVVELEADVQLTKLMETLGEGAARAALSEPAGFVGSLRPYQATGLGWLATLRSLELGACLADDMGLGKTIQLIALLLHEREAGVAHGPTLLICPTSVVGNWKHELARFGPSLRVLVHHGAEREKNGFAEEARAHDIVLSTYALLLRDEAILKTVDWQNLVLDEAQNIKNAETQAARVARTLSADWKLAMTGTPVENRLDELWSIFQLISPGYLGSGEEFRRRFANPIQKARDTAAAEKLKALVAPFILRRVKTDRRIIDDLPEKLESKVYCTLTREQATLYEAVVADGMQQVEASEGIQRRGQVLAMISRLKQICDHPALFMRDGSQLSGRSGKLERLTEMIDEATDSGDRALVFTQYAIMGRLLEAHLSARLDREVLFLHGGTTSGARDRMVDRFQNEEHGPQVFILSLKAGGTGLNLTRANHVFHFDRWWNPAVENQATDRAFRIGQRRDVQVHKLLCAGTLEEALDDVIERKLALAEAIVGTSEAWITEMTTHELRDLLTLRADALVAA